MLCLRRGANAMAAGAVRVTTGSGRAVAVGPGRIGRTAAVATAAAAFATAAAAHIEAAQKKIDEARLHGRLGLFPPIEPYATGFITSTTASGTVHRIFYEECGNPDGKPVVFVHGGPGG